jgi:hypothetical protein
MALDFHVSDITEFNILIGHPLEKLFLEPPKIGDLDVKLGRGTFTIPITQAKNSVAESLSHLDMPKEVMSVLPFKSPESSLEKDAKLFVEEEDDLGETIDLLLVFLNTYKNNPQAHGITIVAFHPEVFRVSYFHEERRCKSLLASSPRVIMKKDSLGSEVF